MKCRHCQSELELPFIDLGCAPPSNAYLSGDDLNKSEVTYPLQVMTCTSCWLVQTHDYANADELFKADYAYFSSTSTSWLAHAENYCNMIIKRLALTEQSHVVELASNDGYLLKNFVARGIPCLGVEPTQGTAEAARAKGIPVRQDFFGMDLARDLVEEGLKADLILGNNVYAHVPDINDFTKAIAHLLKPEGVVTLEFPHLLRLIEQNQFDTIYHEHFSYLGLHAVSSLFEMAGLRIFDVEKLPTHGGSLRVYGCFDAAAFATADAVKSLLAEEVEAGLLEPATYRAFQRKAEKVKNDFLAFLLKAKSEGKSVAGYGAAAKGNSLMNFAGIGPDLMPYVCDASPSKIGKFLPGSRIPIYAPQRLEKDVPDYVVIFPWNIATEITSQLSHLKAKGARFVVAVPELRILE